MSDIAECMDALAEALNTIPDLRAYGYYVAKIVPPAAVVDWPEDYQFDSTMQRGSDRVMFPVGVVVGQFDARSTRDRLAQYVKGDGAYSVKAAIEDFQTDAWYSARVQSVKFDSVQIAATTYLAASFDVELLIPGKA